MENWSYDSVSGFIGAITAFVFFLIPSVYRLFWRKKAKYNCADCKSFDCDGKACWYIREKAKQGN